MGSADLISTTQGAHEHPTGVTPPKGEGWGEGERRVQTTSRVQLDERFMDSFDVIFSAHCDHEPFCASPSPLNGERAGVSGGNVPEAHVLPRFMEHAPRAIAPLYIFISPQGTSC